MQALPVIAVVYQLQNAVFENSLHFVLQLLQPWYNATSANVLQIQA